MKKYKIIIIIIAFVFFSGIISIRFFSPEDDWICQNNEWVKHGNPRAEKPSAPCGNVVLENKPQIIGGPCSYDEQKGKCGIVSISDDGTIKFRFSGDEGETPSDGVYEDTVSPLFEENANYLDSNCVRNLNKYPVEKNDLKNCGIEELKIVDCAKKTIKEGTCTPIIYSFN